THIVLVCDGFAPSHEATRYRWAGRHAVSNQASAHARVRIQPHGPLRPFRRSR
ncbi:hypothetical protein BGW80DRAFT_1416677, partial [Lactifluus volemus]